MQTTPIYDIAYPDTGDPSSLQTLMSAQASSVEEALISFMPRIISGRAVVTGVVANTPTTFHVDFPTGFFETTPNVVASADSAVTGTTVAGVGATNVTTTGFNIIVTRTNTTNTLVQWIAVSSPQGA